MNFPSSWTELPAQELLERCLRSGPHWASLGFSGHLGAIEHALRSGANPSAIEPDTGKPLLALACANGMIEAAWRLTQAGADPTASSSSGVSPLHWLACHSERRALTLLDHLIDLGADPNAQAGSSSGPPARPLRVAINRGNLSAALLLLERGARLAPLPGEVSFLSLSASLGDTRLMTLLMAHGVDPLAADPTAERLLPLHWASRHAHPEAIRLLLLHGARVEDTDAQGRDALAHAHLSASSERALRALIDTSEMIQHQRLERAELLALCSRGLAAPSQRPL